MPKTLKEAKAEFRRENPNLRVNGWDERDYELSSALQSLTSYGLLPNNDRMISRKSVEKLIKAAAEERFEREWKGR